MWKDIWKIETENMKVKTGYNALSVKKSVVQSVS